MEKIKLAFLILTFLSLSSLTYSQALDQPESMVYDAVNDRYLISNMPSGDILARANDGTLTYFNQGASESIRGITILGGYLYCAGNEGVIVFNLSTDTYVETFTITGAQWINDICADANNFLYVTDADKIYKVNSDGGASSLFTDQVEGSNGIIYDPANDRLLVTEDIASDGVNPSYGRISAISMDGSTLTPMVDVPGQWLDGIAIDSEGNYYVGSWETGIIYQYPPTLDGTPVDLVTGITGAADFCFNPVANELGIPLMDDNDIMFFSLGDPVGVEDIVNVPVTFTLRQNYPNPFNPSTTISYSIPERSNVSIKVYDMLGEEVATIENGIRNAGTYNLNFNAAELPSGIYFYTLKVNEFQQTRKMMLLK